MKKEITEGSTAAIYVSRLKNFTKRYLTTQDKIYTVYTAVFTSEIHTYKLNEINFIIVVYSGTLSATNLIFYR